MGCLAFMDGITIRSEMKEDVNKQLYNMRKTARRIGIRVTYKTKTMNISTGAKMKCYKVMMRNPVLYVAETITLEDTGQNNWRTRRKNFWKRYQE